MIVKCPSCSGTGGKPFGLGVMACLLSVVYIPLIYCERNDSNGFTREPCNRCKGTGYIKKRAVT